MAKFSNAKVGDRVWSVICGEGVIVAINTNSQYPITVNFKNNPNKCFDKEGRNYIKHNPELFWNEFHIPTDEEDKKPFNLIEFLKENIEPTDFKSNEENLYIYYSYKKNQFCYDSAININMITVVYLKCEDCYNITNILNKNKITPEQLKQAYKELGWL